MKAYLTGEANSLDVMLFSEVQEDLFRLIGDSGIEEANDAEVSYDAIAQAQREGEARAEEPVRSDGGEEVEPTGETVSDTFGGEPVAYYLKEVSHYPMLTREREAELAIAIREGLNSLVRMVEGHAVQDPAIQDLDRKLKRLLSREKNFPGVRDKAPRMIRGTLERLLQAHPGHRLYTDLYSRTRALMSTIDAAKHEFVKANLRLVLSMAKRYRSRGMSLDDLIQEGNLGLLTAVGRFDHTKGNRFSTYATHWIRQSIIRGIYVKTRTIRLPVHFIELKNRFFKVFYELLKELGREPTPREIASRAGLSPEKVHQVMRLSLRPVSLETPVGENGHRLGDLIEDERAVAPTDHCSYIELTRMIRHLLSTLQPREEEILRLRFGLDGRAAETLEEIGKTFKVSKERIRQIEKKALGKLRKLNRQNCLANCVD